MDAKKRKKASGSPERDENEGTELPPSLLMEIFLRLPIMTLGKCRCVSKTWFRIISSPEFAKLHLSVSPTCILIKNKPPQSESKRLLLSQVFEVPGTKRFRFDRMNFTPRFDLPNIGFQLVNSCNGLVCLSGDKAEFIYVCNPVLGEYITIQVPDDSDSYGRSFGLGFSSRSNIFKVLHTFSLRTEEPGLLLGGTRTSKAVIYTLGTGLWRSIENVPDDIEFRCWFNSFLHGTLHWATVKEKPELCCKITCFNFEDDLFGEIPAPPQFQLDLGTYDELRLGVYDGCLSACCYHGAWDIYIWVMKEYGVKESWVTQFQINSYDPTDGYEIEFYYPLIFLKNGEIIISFNNEQVVSYNLKRETLRDTGLSRTRGEFDAVGYTPCFVSLEDVANGEQITRYLFSNYAPP
ncbi:hypothetical protein COLO4_15938 [Corchorus olitorius]|uniref:F-box domain-containing protein n=1 Tax=Corchorus olitorius TaxID=93759 RepID=A0A1R3JKM2_9ROSI|nr:hypothetical protein COLO4_15938 [Corchorus olitorius]